MTPLHTAVQKGADVIAKVLLEAGADVNAVDDKVGLHVTATNTSMLDGQSQVCMWCRARLACTMLHTGVTTTWYSFCCTITHMCLPQIMRCVSLAIIASCLSHPLCHCPQGLLFPWDTPSQLVQQTPSTRRYACAMALLHMVLHSAATLKSARNVVCNQSAHCLPVHVKAKGWLAWLVALLLVEGMVMQAKHQTCSQVCVSYRAKPAIH